MLSRVIQPLFVGRRVHECASPWHSRLTIPFSLASRLCFLHLLVEVFTSGTLLGVTRENYPHNRRVGHMGNLTHTRRCRLVTCTLSGVKRRVRWIDRTGRYSSHVPMYHHGHRLSLHRACAEKKW